MEGGEEEMDSVECFESFVLSVSLLNTISTGGMADKECDASVLVDNNPKELPCMDYNNEDLLRDPTKRVGKGEDFIKDCKDVHMELETHLDPLNAMMREWSSNVLLTLRMSLATQHVIKVGLCVIGQKLCDVLKQKDIKTMNGEGVRIELNWEKCLEDAHANDVLVRKKFYKKRLEQWSE